MEHRCRIQSFCEWWRLAALLFIGIAVVVSIFLIKLILENRHKGEAIAYSLILGGAMGNLIDRVFRGYVVDSFDFYWRDWHWPAFNLRSEEHTSELQSRPHLVCRLLLEK